MLESVGLLEVRRGIGVFVAAFSLEPLIWNLPIANERLLPKVERAAVLHGLRQASILNRSAMGPVLMSPALC